MKIIVTGANGQLGKELVRQGNRLPWHIKALSHNELDITKKLNVRHLFLSENPDFIINCAAYTKVDDAEIYSEIAFNINQKGVAILSESCEEYNVPIVHISTDFVFDGKKQIPYVETDPVSPLGVYGKSKALGELEIIDRLEKYIIIRTSWLYGVDGQNFVKTMLKAGLKNKTLNVVNDQFGSPTSVVDLASAIIKIIKSLEETQNSKWGLYHYCGEGIVSWHGFAEAIFHIAGLDPMPIVRPITSDQYPVKAKRPCFSALDCTKISETFGIKAKPWKESLVIVVNQLSAKPEANLFP